MRTTAPPVTIPGNPALPWESVALSAIEHLAKAGRPFTAADLDDLGVPAPDHSCRWGSVFAKAQALGLIRKVGYVQSRRPSRSYGICSQWGGPR